MRPATLHPVRYKGATMPLTLRRRMICGTYCEYPARQVATAFGIHEGTVLTHVKLARRQYARDGRDAGTKILLQHRMREDGYLQCH